MTITVHGTPVALLKRELQLGKEAPACRVKNSANQESVVGMIAPKIQLFMSVPSLKTEVCSLGAKVLSEHLKAYIDKVDAYIVTADSTEDIAQFSQNNALEGVEMLSDYMRQFGNKYGVLISEGKLENLLARALFIVDKEGTVFYKQIVDEVTHEIDYTAAVKAIEELLSQKRPKGHTHENWMMA